MIDVEIRKLGQGAIGKEIPKPEAKAPFRIKGLGVRRGQEALTYTIPSHSKKSKYYVKGITIEEFEKVYSQLVKNGIFTHQWFNAQLSDCAKEGSCNFTTIGGIFELLGIAKYAERGKYIAIKRA